MENQLVCPVCGSADVKCDTIAEQTEKSKKGVFYWVCIGWWLEPLEWILFTVPKLVCWIIGSTKLGNKTKIKTKTKTYATCQHCGYRWEIK